MPFFNFRCSWEESPALLTVYFLSVLSPGRVFWPLGHRLTRHHRWKGFPALYSYAIDLNGNTSFAFLQYSATSDILDGIPSYLFRDNANLPFYDVHIPRADIVDEQMPW